jgi:anti-anti-sigma factor
MTFEAAARENAGVAVLQLSGDLDGTADKALNAAYASAIEPNPTRVLLNFADVSYINSTGIALIVGLLAEARTSGRKMLACGLSEHYREIFEITRISDFVEIHPDEASAVGTTAPT